MEKKGAKTRNVAAPLRYAASNYAAVHNIDILSLLFGSLLGDSWGECRNKKTRSVRFILQQESSNMEYLHWFHNYLAERDYCSKNSPKKYKRISTRNKIRYYYKISTFSYTNLKWLYDAFYKNKIKSIPNNEHIKILLTPLALAVWFMDDGSIASVGTKIATNGFKKEDLKRIQKIIKELYNINCNIQSAGIPLKEQYILYFPKAEMPKLSKIIKKHIVPSMYYKLNGF